MDQYILPQCVMDILLKMRKNSVVSMKLNDHKLLLSNFPMSMFGLDLYDEMDKHFKDAKSATITMSLLEIEYPKEFDDMSCAEKLDRVLKLKATATNFFKETKI